MISHLHLENRGPIPVLEVDFSPRVNLITGDNGLGKTLILDMAWYALTRTWPEDRKALPNFGEQEAALIACAIRGAAGTESTISSTYDRKLQDWRVSRGKPTKPGLIVYARIDGGFSIWDPARNYGRGKKDDTSVRAGEALRLNRTEVWEGEDLCLGLLLDWESWRLSNNGAWKLFGEVLLALSPAAAGRDNPAIAAERLVPLPALRLQIGDAKPTPFLQMPYGKVPVTQCSAGMRRILAMAYMLVWAWLRHQEDAKLTGEKPTNSVVLLWDEVEAHLHPQWQRLILPAMMKVVSAILLQEKTSDVQSIATTHAPLVLSSLETHCTDEQDLLLNLQIGRSGVVELEIIPWAKYGDVTGWSVYQSHWNKGVINLDGLRKDAPLIADAVEARMREGKPLPGPEDVPAASGGRASQASLCPAQEGEEAWMSWAHSSPALPPQRADRTIHRAEEAHRASASPSS